VFVNFNYLISNLGWLLDQRKGRIVERQTRTRTPPRVSWQVKKEYTLSHYIRKALLYSKVSAGLTRAYAPPRGGRGGFTGDGAGELFGEGLG
jgi:hypothetical protein